jgi:hypothetical protein
MKIEKQHVVDFLSERGLKEHAARAAERLPDPVDTEEHHRELSLLGVDLEDLVGGIGGLGGVGDRHSSDTQ